MSVSKMNQIDKAMEGARRRTKADVAQQLAGGTPVATMDDDGMTLQQLVPARGPQLVTATVKPRPVRSNLSQLSARALKAYSSLQRDKDAAERMAG